MAINRSLLKIGRPSLGRTKRPPEPLAVGEVEANVFTCPNCARPLANGANLCPGCGTRLIAGVRARLAMTFMVVGLIAGTMLGAGSMLVVGGRSSAPATDSTGVTGQVPGAGAAVGTSATPVQPADVGVPSKPYSALRQAAVINGRLSGYAAELDQALKSRSTKGIDIARILRSMSADVVFGLAVAPTVAGWPEAADLSSDLERFYAKVRDAAQASLKASVSNGAAYKAAGKRMAKLLAALPALEARSAEIVAAAGLDPLTP